MKKGIIVTLGMALIVVLAQAIPANAALGAGAAGPVASDGGTCVGAVEIHVTYVGVDLQPLGTSGSARATGRGLCGGSILVRILDVHTYVDGELVDTATCGGTTCSGEEVDFSGAATVTLRAVSHIYYELTSGVWKAAGPGCYIYSRVDAICEAIATTVV